MSTNIYNPSRLLNTGDSNDYVISNSLLYFLWSYKLEDATPPSGGGDFGVVMHDFWATNPQRAVSAAVPHTCTPDLSLSLPLCGSMCVVNCA
jgi:hypothetical protein